MRCLTELPEGYAPCLRIDMQKDKKTAVTVNLLALALMAAVAAAGFFLEPEGAAWGIWQATAVLLGYFAYILLHEAVHGACMRALGSKTVRFGFTGLYAFAASSEIYSKRAYILIALAPAVFWGAVFALAAALAPPAAFWPVWLLLAMNIGGAAGDFYVAAVVARLSPDLLVQDADGVAMTVFVKESGTEG